jgi:hypothetical protein
MDERHRRVTDYQSEQQPTQRTVKAVGESRQPFDFDTGGGDDFDPEPGEATARRMGA